jgi:hypothetical protein
VTLHVRQCRTYPPTPYLSPYLPQPLTLPRCSLLAPRVRRVAEEEECWYSNAARRRCEEGGVQREGLPLRPTQLPGGGGGGRGREGHHHVQRAAPRRAACIERRGAGRRPSRRVLRGRRFRFRRLCLGFRCLNDERQSSGRGSVGFGAGLLRAGGAARWRPLRDARRGCVSQARCPYPVDMVGTDPRLVLILNTLRHVRCGRSRRRPRLVSMRG